MSQKTVGTLAIVALLVTGCADRKSLQSALNQTSAPIAESAKSVADLSGASIGQVRLAQAPAPPASAQPRPDRNSPPITGERKLIRNGEMALHVRSITTALASLRQIMTTVGGQTANQLERQNQYGGRTASVTCRIPAERLDAAIEAIKGLGDQRALTFTTEDVTADYFDVTVRINTQKALERQLVVLLQRASNRLSDLLEIERELARVREDIDRMEGRVRMWDSQVALSSLVITLEEPAPVVVGTGGGPLRTLAESFNEAAENFVLAVAMIIAATGAILPVALLIGPAIWVGVKIRRRRSPVAPAV